MKKANSSVNDLILADREKRELARQREQRMLSHTFAPISIKAGAIGIIGPCVIRQRPEDGLVYFNTDESKLFELVEYSWSGPVYNLATQVQNTGYTTSNTTKKGKAGKMTAGALIGTALLPGVGTVVGAAIGASGKSKSATAGNSFSSSNQVTRQIEQPGTAVLKFRHINSGNIFPVTIVCNSEIDAKIRCFQFRPQKTASELSQQTVDILKGVKALKELYDMGALSEEEFEKKKNQLLNSK